MVHRDGKHGGASLFTVLVGAFWGLYWVPVRRLAETALPGAWGSLAIVAVAALLLVPVAILSRRSLSKASPLALASLALGGASFVMYSVGLVYGRVAIVILLFFLTPVWSTLIGRLCFGWTTPRLRYGAILAGLTGLLLVLGADGGLPLPHDVGDWLGLVSGMLWAVASTGIRTRNHLGPGASTFVFALGAVAMAAVLTLAVAPWPGFPAADTHAQAVFWTLAAAGPWWCLSLAGLLWATARLEPARVGILLMSEVAVGVVSAALFAGEPLGATESVGGLLIVAAAVLEVWPVRSERVATDQRT